MQRKLRIYSDGGSRGNPGPAAGAFLILSENNEVLRKHSIFLGERTNNQAEYEALISALESAAELGAQEIVSHLDSELVCKHLTGEYKVKNPELKRLWSKVQKIKTCFKAVNFISIPRTDKYIQEADSQVNDQLNKSTKLHNQR